MSKEIRNKRTYTIHIFFLIFALVVEIFVCNIRTFQSMFYKERDILEYPVQIDNAHLLSNGDLELDGDSAFISIIIDDEKIHNIYIDVETECAVAPDTEKGVCDLTLYVQDELVSGGVSKPRSVVKRKLLNSIESSHYVFFESFGNAKLIQLELHPQNGKVVHFNSIKLNARRPMLFSFIRVLFFVLLMESFYLFRPASWAWQRNAFSPGKMGHAVLMFLYLGFILTVFFFMSSNPLMWQEDFNPYAELARAVTEGRLYVGEASQEIAALEGQLLSWGKIDERVMFDYALYHGKYYVYFGIFPMLVMYLPYLLATGRDMPDAVAMLGIVVILIPGIYALLREMIRRLFVKTPFALMLILTVTIILGSGIPILLSGPQVYSVAILFGVLLTVWGIFLLTKALPFAEHPWLLLFGSSCMALVAACRPTLLLYSLIVIPYVFISYRAYMQDVAKRRKAWVSMVALIVPYATVAFCLMYYNWLRFESPFQFGMIYNMTNIPSRSTAIDVPEMVVLAAFEYLFKPIEYDHLFPFILGHYDECIKEYSGTIYYYRTQGFGLFAVNPVLWILFAIPFIPAKKRKGLTTLVLVTLAVAAFYICFDTYITQWITTRYSLEFSLLMFFVADLLWLTIWERSEAGWNSTVIWLFVSVNIVSALINLLAFFSGPSYQLKFGNTELFYNIFYLWHFL